MNKLPLIYNIKLITGEEVIAETINDYELLQEYEYLSDNIDEVFFETHILLLHPILLCTRSQYNQQTAQFNTVVSTQPYLKYVKHASLILCLDDIIAISEIHDQFLPNYVASVKDFYGYLYGDGLDANNTQPTHHTYHSQLDVTYH
jgi:hypothetical protein